MLPTIDTASEARRQATLREKECMYGFGFGRPEEAKLRENNTARKGSKVRCQAKLYETNCMHRFKSLGADESARKQNHVRGGEESPETAKLREKKLYIQGFKSPEVGEIARKKL